MLIIWVPGFDEGIVHDADVNQGLGLCSLFPFSHAIKFQACCLWSTFKHWTACCSSRMVLSSDTDLLSLLQCIPPLLHACVDGSHPASKTARANFSAFRLVSKEANRVALAAITSYTLTFLGKPTDTCADIARLLRQAKLQSLHVILRSTGVNENVGSAMI